MKNYIKFYGLGTLILLVSTAFIASFGKQALRGLLIVCMLILLFLVKASAQVKKSDTLYIFTEVQIKMIDQLLTVGDNGVATSDAYSRNQWKEYHSQMLKLDSAIKVQYFKFHPVKQAVKK